MLCSYFIGKFYQYYVACDVTDMDKCHIILERQRQYDVDATHKGRENIYVHLKGQKNCLEINSTSYMIYKKKNAFTCIPIQSK